MSRRLSLVLVLLAACTTTNVVAPGGGTLPPPTNLFYDVTSGGPATIPVATLLEWDPVTDGSVNVWNVYSRSNTSQAFVLRGTTTSSSFHDQGVPELQYYVTAVDFDGFESVGSNVVTVDERLTLPRVNQLFSTSLNGAVALAWTDNPFEADPAGFRTYRIFSTPFNLDTGLCLDTGWVLEGTTVAPEFIAGALPNGVPRCFGVSAVTIEGFESLWSPIVDDTPRPDSRNMAITSSQFDASQSGFRFWRDQNGDGLAQDGELGLVLAGASPSADFSMERDGAGQLWLTPVRPEASVALYSGGPISDLTAIDIAPVGGYSHAPVQLLPGYGYVVQITGSADGFLRYGAVRATHVGTEFTIIDWSFQTDPGNPQLLRSGRR
jgi:hypothetical protein